MEGEDRVTHHLILLLLETALLVERCNETSQHLSSNTITCADRRTYIVIAAVKDCLVAPAVLADIRERLDDPQPELLPLLALVDCDILNVADAAETSEELAFNEDAADGDDSVCRFVDDDERVVRVRCGAHGVELRLPCCLAWVGRHGEDAEDVEVATAVVR